MVGYQDKNLARCGGDGFDEKACDNCRRQV